MGPIGMSILVTALVYGIGNFIVIDLIQNRLEQAKHLVGNLAVIHTINSKEVNTLEKRVQMVRELTNGIGADVVIEAAGEPPAFEEAIKHVRRGGTLVEMGHYSDTGDATINPHKDICNKDIQLFGMWAHSSYDMKTAIAVMQRAKMLGIPFGDIIVKEAKLGDTVEMLKLHERRAVPGKIGIVP
jgi:L-iditol 2-dehydrogenase